MRTRNRPHAGPSNSTLRTLSLAGLTLASLVTAAGCGQAHDPAGRFPLAPMAAPIPAAPPREPKAAEAPAKASPLPLDVDPVAVGLSAQGVTALCEGGLATASAKLDAIRALGGAADDQLTWASTLGKLDEATLAVRNAGDLPQLLAVAHPDAAVREAAKACEPRVDRFMTALYLDAKLAGVFKRYAARKEALSPARARLLEHTLRDYRRNGLELDAAKQDRLRKLNEEITQLSQAFETNLAQSTLAIEIKPEQLKGLPPSYVEAHKPGPDGKVRITTDYPDYVPFVQYAADRAAALELYKKFDDRAADRNVAALEKLLALRNEKAKLLGYPTWADYVLEPRMARDAKTVEGFLAGLRKHLKKKGAEEMTELRAMHEKLGGKKGEGIAPSERLYLEDQVRKAKYGLDSQEVSKYLEIGRVKQGLLDITSKLFGISYREAKGPTWHPDVQAVEVLNKAGEVIGRFYFDLYPREGKYKHAAVFSIRETAQLGGARLAPIAAIVCNFPKPGPGAPALMSHQDATTFFHEFGHVLHHLLSESELASFAGTSVARDFVESPSQMLEEWAWSRPTLDLFAKHHETGKPLPEPLFKAMTRSRSFGRAVSTQRQLFLAALDQTYHTRAPGFDSTKVLEETHEAYMPFTFVKGTHFQATFGHLIGYDAGYYGYQWALSIARDLFSRFQREGLMNEATAAAYRAAILAPGGSDDAAKLVEKFLGRPPGDEAYRRFLVGDDRPVKGGAPAPKAPDAPKGDAKKAPDAPKGDAKKAPDAPKGDAKKAPDGKADKKGK